MDKKYRNSSSIVFICKVLNVSRNGYYEGINGLVSDRAKEDKELMVIIKTIFRKGSNTY